MRSFIAGIVVGILGLLTSILFENSKLANNSLLIIGIGSMILAAIFLERWPVEIGLGQTIQMNRISGSV